ncbi:MAG: hypothetical protein DRO18_03650, partial [Thermoprotei archaeon]
MVNVKRKGSRREREVRDILEAWGYYVTKAGGSLGRYDLVAVPRRGKIDVLVIQVKSNRIRKKE